MTGEDQRTRPSPAVQDYLKSIYRVQEDTGRSAVATSEVAEALAVTAPSASAMLKKMGQLGYVTPAGRRGAVELTVSGRAAALEVIRHHRLLETYLVARLGVPWDQVHHEAEILEHHLSEELEARIAEALGHPERDPHARRWAKTEHSRRPLTRRFTASRSRSGSLPGSSAKPARRSRPTAAAPRNSKLSLIS